MQAISDKESTVDLVKRWIEQCVIDLSLCPFASAPYHSGKVRIVEYLQESESGFLALLEKELLALVSDNEDTETTLLVAKNLLPDFYDFNDFLGDAEALLEIDDRQSQVQIASFHPQYQFAGVDVSDAGNYTNRAPFPIVQWLRTDTVAKAVDATDTLAIPERNIKTLQSMNAASLASLFPWVAAKTD